MTAPTREQIEREVASLHDDLAPAIRQARSRVATMLRQSPALATRDIENLYLYDRLHAVLVLADALGRELGELPSDVGTLSSGWPRSQS